MFYKKRIEMLERDIKTVDRTIAQLIEKHNSTFMVLKSLMNNLGYEEYSPLGETARNHQKVEVRKISKKKSKVVEDVEDDYDD